MFQACMAPHAPAGSAAAWAARVSRTREGASAWRREVRRCAIALLLSMASTFAAAGTSYQGGNISNTTTVPEGLLIMLDTGPPSNCAGTPYGWMLIPEANKTMVAATLALWLTGKTNVTVYVSSYSGSGYCTINQVDPGG